MKQAVRTFKSLGDPTRLRIVKLLENGELCVCQLMAVLGMGQSRISRHLSILKQAGLILDRRQGKWVHYRLCCREPLRETAACWKKADRDPAIAHDRKALKKARPLPRCEYAHRNK
jgi:DNA-binding transcriptional ArsR family regulator